MKKTLRLIEKEFIYISYILLITTLTVMDYHYRQNINVLIIASAFSSWVFLLAALREWVYQEKAQKEIHLTTEQENRIKIAEDELSRIRTALNFKSWHNHK